MSKGLEALQDIRLRLFIESEVQSKKVIKDLKTIEKELKQAKENEKLLNVFKNALTIERKSINNIHAFNKDRESCISGLVSEIIEIKQNELDEKLRKSLREWVLNNAFPKELKALEIIKKYIRVGKPFGSACYIYLNDESEMIPEEQFDLLKEVLL